MRKLQASAERGATLVEFAQLLPVYLLFVFGIIDLSTFITQHALVEHALEVAGRDGAYRYEGTECVDAATERFDNYVQAFWFAERLSPAAAVVETGSRPVGAYGTSVDAMPALLLSVDMPISCMFCELLGFPPGSLMINKSALFPTERCS